MVQKATTKTEAKYQVILCYGQGDKMKINAFKIEFVFIDFQK